MTIMAERPDTPPDDAPNRGQQQIAASVLARLLVGPLPAVSWSLRPWGDLGGHICVYSDDDPYSATKDAPATWAALHAWAMAMNRPITYRHYPAREDTEDRYVGEITLKIQDVPVEIWCSLPTPDPSQPGASE